LRGGPNIIELLDVVHDSENPNFPSILLEHVENTDPKKLYPTFTDMDVRFYMYELLKALDYCHSHDIMHRDIKPRNVVIDHASKKLRLVDWGLASFHQPGQEYGVRVSSLHYKAPELLVGLKQYDCAIDTWSAGCMLASFVFKQERAFFLGHDDTSQLCKISTVLGTSKLFAFLKKYGLELDPAMAASVQRHSRRPWENFVSLQNLHLASPEALDLIDKMLVYDPACRLSAKDAMAHPYFDPIRQEQGRSVPLAFKPGQLGIITDLKGLVTRVLPNGQAERAGIAVGWYIHEIQGLRFTASVLQRYLEGKQGYSITFKQVTHPDRQAQESLSSPLLNV